MCNYNGYEFNKTQKNSICIEGYLFDSDSFDGFGYSIPSPSDPQIRCPNCNPIKI